MKLFLAFTVLRICHTYHYLFSKGNTKFLSGTKTDFENKFKDPINNAETKTSQNYNWKNDYAFSKADNEANFFSAIPKIVIS